MKRLILLAFCLCFVLCRASVSAVPPSCGIFYDGTNNITITWNAEGGNSYGIVTTTNLAESWKDALTTPPVLTATTNKLSYTFQTATDSRFFKVVAVGPQAHQFVPSDGAFGISPGASIQLFLTAPAGIDSNSITLTIGTSQPMTLADSRLSYTNGILTYTPDAPMGNNGDVMTVRVSVADLAGLQRQFVWSFQLELLTDMTSFLTGVSEYSVGRFGGKAGNDNAKLNTLLTFMVDTWRIPGVSLYWPQYAGVADAPRDVPEYGCYKDAYFFGQFGPIVNNNVAGSYFRISDVGWEHMDHELKANNLVYRVSTSLLSPGIQFKLPLHQKMGLFYTTLSAGLGGVRCVAVPTAGGIQRHVVDSNGYLTLNLGTTMSEGWILVWFNGSQNWNFDFPCLIALQHRPQTIAIKPAGMDLTFANKADMVAMVPLYGIKRLPLSETQSWLGSGLPEEVLAKARFWNRALKAYPRTCQEQYRSRESTSSVDIKLNYTYDMITDDWGTQPLCLAPIPPAVGYAADQGYEVTYPSLPESYMDTLQGPYYALSNSQTAQYTLPAYTRYIDKTYDVFAPPRITNSSLVTQVQKSIRDYYDNFLPGWNPQANPSGADLGQQIFPGIMCYPFLDGKNQLVFKQKAMAGLTSVVMSASSYTNYIDGISGKQVPIDIHSYDAYGQEIQDADWYHAYAMYASWAYAHYFNRWDIISSNWATISTKWLPIFKFSSDWSTQCWWANSQGIGLGSEDINLGFGAMVALARISKHQGATALYDECLYMIAKTALTDFSSHFTQQYVDDLKPWRNKDLCLDSDSTAPGEGWSEHFGVQFARYDHSQGLWLSCIAPFNPSWPEVSWFFADTGIKTMARSAMNTNLLASYPNWLTDQGNSMWGNVKILLPIMGYLIERDSQALYDDINTFYALAPKSPNYTPWAYVSVIGATLDNTIPTNAPSGPTFFADASYAGRGVSLGAGNYTLAQLQAAGIANDTISSFKMPAGYTVLVWEDDNFSGSSRVFTTGSSDLVASEFDNMMSSVQIFNTTAVAILYPNASYTGKAVALSPGNYQLSQLQSAGMTDNTVTSLKIIGDYTLFLFDGDSYGGSSWAFTAENPNLLGNGDNAASSIRIIRSGENATFYPNANYGGTGVMLEIGTYRLSQLRALGIENDSISSLKVPAGRSVVIYTDDNFSGQVQTFTADTPNLTGGFDNSASSIKIE